MNLKLEDKGALFIDFEGLDCSFKETNSKLLKLFLGDSAKRYEFPCYNADSSYFVRQYLSGMYEPKEMNYHAIYGYLLDMFHQYETIIKQDIKNGIKYVIFDRFWYSNIFYQAKTEEQINEIIDIATNKLGLPKCHIIIKMIPEKQVMIDYVMKKKNKDMHETNIIYLSEVYDRFVSTSFGIWTKHVYTSNNGVVKPKFEIFKDILENLKFANIVKESDVNAFCNKTTPFAERF